VTTITALLTNKAYGYPTRGSRRRRKPTILGCLHQTANAKATAIGERNYANRAGSGGPSATAYIDRDGTIVRAASLLLRQGVHPKVVSERLGHASVAITLDTYSHILPGLGAAAAAALDLALAEPELAEVR
jgi:integrase